jgi:hypothetical protein
MRLSIDRWFAVAKRAEREMTGYGLLRVRSMIGWDCWQRLVGHRFRVTRWRPGGERDPAE